MTGSTERVGRRAHGDEGAALVEFALVAVLLFSLIFGIIHYGLILSFKQDMTRAAAEGARAGAVAFPATDAETEAEAATVEAINEFGGGWTGTGCETGAREGMDCSVVVDDCEPSNPGQQCVFVTLEYDYGANPLFGEIPLLGGLTDPETITAESVARTNE